MELKDFVKNVITDITEAVEELQEELNNGTIVSPSMPCKISNVTVTDPGNRSNRPISKIDFDVAITVGNSDRTTADGRMGIQILSAKFEGGNEEYSENVSKVRFSIPVVLPTVHMKSASELDKEAHQKRIYQQTSPGSDSERDTP